MHPLAVETMSAKGGNEGRMNVQHAVLEVGRNEYVLNEATHHHEVEQTKAQ